MKILIKLLAVCFTVALIFVFSGFTAEENNAAVVIKDGTCYMPDGNGDGVFADGMISVQTSSDHISLVCKAKDVANDTGKAVHWDFDSTGIPCLTALGITEDWKAVISASGNATFTCKLKVEL